MLGPGSGTIRRCGPVRVGVALLEPVWPLWSGCGPVGIGVGFLEEVIFRGLLFKAMERDNEKSAIIVSSLTFGTGHLLNLFNGSGMDLADNFIQIIFATAVGFLFVTIFYRSKSLLPCIMTHSAINTLSTFANEAAYAVEKQIIHILVMIALTVAYTLILTRTIPKSQCANAGGGADK